MGAQGEAVIPLKIAKGLTYILPKKGDPDFERFAHVHVITEKDDSQVFAEVTNGAIVAQVIWEDRGFSEIGGEFYIMSEDLRLYVRTKGVDDLPFTEETPYDFPEISAVVEGLRTKRNRRGKTFGTQISILKQVMAFATNIGIKKGMFFTATRTGEPIKIEFEPEEKTEEEKESEPSVVEAFVLIAPYTWSPK